MMSRNKQDLYVHSITYEAEEIFRIELRSPVGDSLAEFTAGAHINLHLADRLVRSYSLVNNPSERHHYIIAVQKEKDGRGGSKWVHETLRVGQRVEVSAPGNAFPLNEGAEHTVLVAGGIGITPIWCMIQRLEALGKSWELHYRTRSRQRAAFLEEVSSGQRSGHVHLSFSNETPRAGYDLQRIIADAPEKTEFYCCGPAEMIARFDEVAAGMDATRFHRERFQTEGEASGEGGFVVRAVKSNLDIPVREGQTILQALREAGLDPPYSCESGLCGECETRVIAGEPDHRDYFLTEAEKNSGEVIMICCSGSCSPVLEIDL
ncbi:MAG: oxidoreductase [Sneathiella sp.]|uniref:PDR/VanB family oxidoreductase n=1 Tax=Sneathiella sp. TaxID=1964365 RepID=UPI000C634477|nr:PDR/VanB family oxidoreductase [Sneathiella sp.]MAL77869.1 oxidoreductase [Sneathiella sp.]